MESLKLLFGPDRHAWDAIIRSVETALMMGDMRGLNPVRTTVDNGTLLIYLNHNEVDVSALQQDVLRQTGVRVRISVSHDQYSVFVPRWGISDSTVVRTASNMRIALILAGCYMAYSIGTILYERL